MLKKLLFILLIGSLTNACTVQLHPAVSEMFTPSAKLKPYYLQPTTFIEPNDWDEVIQDCNMLQAYEQAILYTAKKFELRAELETASSKKNTPRVKLEYIDIIPNVLRQSSFRASSVVSFRVTLSQKGEIINSVTETVSSSVANRTCERLDKIAKSAARFTHVWVAEQI